MQQNVETVTISKVEYEYLVSTGVESSILWPEANHAQLSTAYQFGI